MFLKISQNLQENTCTRVSFLLLKKRLWYRCFPVNFAKFLRTPFLQNPSGQRLLNALCTFNLDPVFKGCCSHLESILGIIAKSQLQITEKRPKPITFIFLVKPFLNSQFSLLLPHTRHHVTKIFPTKILIILQNFCCQCQFVNGSWSNANPSHYDYYK